MGTSIHPHTGVARNSLYNLISIASRRGFMSIGLLCFAAVLSVQEYALITVGISLAGVFTILANWGYLATITRYTSDTIVRCGRFQTRRLARRLMMRQTAGAIGKLIVFVCLGPFVEPLLRIGWPMYVLACCLGLFVSLTDALNAVLTGLERFQALARINFMWFLGTVLVALLLLGARTGFKSASFGLVFLLAAFIALAVSMGLVSARFLSGDLNSSDAPLTPWSEITEYCRHSGWLGIVGSILYYRTEVLFLRHWSTAQDVAAYALGQTLASLLFVAFLRGAVGTLLPRFSMLHALGRKEQLESLYVSIQRMLLYILFPAAFFCILVAPALIPLVFGPQYQQSVMVFQLFVPIFVLVTHSAVGQSYLFAVSRQRSLIPLLAICLFLNLLLDVVLIRPWGIQGAVFGVGIPLVVSGCGSLVLAGMNRALLPGIWPSAKGTACMVLYAMGAHYVRQNLSWVYLAGFSVVLVSGYVVLMMPEFRDVWNSFQRSELVSTATISQEKQIVGGSS